jgi:hypothetical protein
MQRIMQYNDWQNDPFSLQDPCNQVSCRADLEPKNGTINTVSCFVLPYVGDP